MLFLIHWIQKNLRIFHRQSAISMRQPFVITVILARRQLDLTRYHVLIGTLGKNVRDAIEPGATLAVSLNRIPGRLRDIR